MKTLYALALLTTLPTVSLAQDEGDIVVDSATVTACFEKADWKTPNPDCIGDAATICREADGGTNDRGAAMCVAAETDVWRELMQQALDTMREKVAALDAARNGSMDPTLPALEAAQAAWDEASARQCIFEEDIFADGTIGIVMGADCTMRSYAARALQLKIQSDWF